MSISLSAFYAWRKYNESRLNLFVIVSSFLATIAALSPVIFNSGWPLNHDHLMWKIHTETYAANFMDFNFLPIWSTRDAHGMGAPTPLYYHKLFYYVSAVFLILFGKIKISIICAIFFFSQIGIFGVFKISRMFGNSKITSTLIGLSLIFLNYTMCNWFLRGAMAEFAAMMIIPFLFYYLFKFLKTKTVSYMLFPVLLFIYLAHSIIAYYSVYVILIAFIIFIFISSRKQIIQCAFKIVLSGLFFILSIIIFLVPIYLLSDSYDPSLIKDEGNVPWNKIIIFSRYIFDTEYKWFTEPYWMFSPQFDLPVIMIVFLCVIFLIILRKKLEKGVNISILIFIVTCNIFLIYLQTKYSVFFYKNVPGADFVQFPWRLLSFIQILNLTLLLWFLSKLKGIFSNIDIYISAVLLVILIFIYPPFRGTSYFWYSSDEIEKPVEFYCNNGEYLSKIKGDKFYFLNPHNSLLKCRGIEIKEKGNNFLEFENEDAIKKEIKVLWLEANFKTASEIILPVSYSSLIYLYIVAHNVEKRIPVFRTITDSRIRANLPAGKYKLKLLLPCITNVFSYKKPLSFSKEVFDIDCDMENLSTNPRYFVSNSWQSVIDGGNLQSTENSRSWNNSIKLTTSEPYGLTTFIPLTIGSGEVWEASIWRYGSKGALIVSGKNNLYISANSPSEKDERGWELLRIMFEVPESYTENDTIIVFAFQGNDPVNIYFDDFSIKRLSLP